MLQKLPDIFVRIIQHMGVGGMTSEVITSRRERSPARDRLQLIIQQQSVTELYCYEEISYMAFAYTSFNDSTFIVEHYKKTFINHYLKCL